MAGETLKEARRRRGLSQRGLARLAGVPQSTISEIESGRRQPTLPLLGRILDRIGRPVEIRLFTEDRFATTAVVRQAARALGGELPGGVADSQAAREDAALRSILDLRDALLREDPERALSLVAERPGTCGDRRFDALVAAVVEDACARHRVSPPYWTQEPDRFVRPFWYLSEVEGLHWWEFATAPGAFVRHGVLAAQDELESA
ncbi:MAG: helix-turn-helix transcriptional regulator [Nitrososphaerales archaeon]